MCTKHSTGIRNNCPQLTLYELEIIGLLKNILFFSSKLVEKDFFFM